MYLTRRQRDVFNYIMRFLRRKGYPPTLEEICLGLGLSSIATVHKHLRNLEAKGVIRRRWNHGRSIEVVRDIRNLPSAVDIPIIGEICRRDNLHPSMQGKTVSVSQDMIRNKECFALVIEGKGMPGFLLNKGDILILERSADFEDGNLILGATEKKDFELYRIFRHSDHLLRIDADNGKSMVLDSGKMQIRGIALGMIRRFI